MARRKSDRKVRTRGRRVERIHREEGERREGEKGRTRNRDRKGGWKEGKREKGVRDGEKGKR